MPTLGLIVEPLTTPYQTHGADRALLALAVARGWGVLRVSQVAGDVLALGRYHLAPAGAPTVTVHRRLSGGRCAATGSGFVHVSLVLPHRSALVSDDPAALAPEQVLNRAVRGVLGGLEAAGVPAIYPGRDTITASRRTLAVLGFEIDASGGTLVDVVLAVERDQGVLPIFLDRADPDGVVGAQLTLPDDATSLARETGRVPALEEIVAWIRHGYETRLGVSFEEETAPAVAPGDEDDFVRTRLRNARLDRRGTMTTMLGLLEAHCAVAGDGSLAEVMLAGDLLAPSGTVSRLEQALRGCTPTVDRLNDVIEHVVRPPHDFILGVGPLRTIGETIARAVA